MGPKLQRPISVQFNNHLWTLILWFAFSDSLEGVGGRKKELNFIEQVHDQYLSLYPLKLILERTQIQYIWSPHPWSRGSPEMGSTPISINGDLGVFTDFSVLAPTRLQLRSKCSSQLDFIGCLLPWASNTTQAQRAKLKN